MTALFDDPSSPYRREDFNPAIAGPRAESLLNLAVVHETCKADLFATARKLESNIAGRGMPEVEGLMEAAVRRYAERTDARYREAVGRS
ncbi:hypothetical protein [Streptomyces sp. 351MFTsu5.1]|uniref:hypothetical protein n=1 Tax=Streptomyces sp. 351MFTsu5.1 TaxID=1172180 RepID=UPI001319D021|nr:hypothetical protein [Streptomyces sp. 351MFTsu5.1]